MTGEESCHQILQLRIKRTVHRKDREGQEGHRGWPVRKRYVQEDVGVHFCYLNEKKNLGMS